MSTYEWKELNTIQDVAAAQAAGMEIELKIGAGHWLPWIGKHWSFDCDYRARPRKPKELVRIVFSDNGTTSLYRAREPECKFNNSPDVVWDKHLSQNQVQELLKNPYGMFSKPPLNSMFLGV